MIEFDIGMSDTDLRHTMHLLPSLGVSIQTRTARSCNSAPEEALASAKRHVE